MAKPKQKARAATSRGAKTKPAGRKPTRPTPVLVTKESIHTELGATLASLRGDEAQERVAIANAIDAFMQLAIAEGLPASTSAYEAQCPEFFWEGDGANPPVYARVPDATHDDIGRWFQFIVEGVRAYDARAQVQR